MRPPLPAFRPFNPFLGDRAFFGYFGEELTPSVAGAGTYRVRLTIDGQRYDGSLRVREDPILTRSGTESLDGSEHH